MWSVPIYLFFTNSWVTELSYLVMIIFFNLYFTADQMYCSMFVFFWFLIHLIFCVFLFGYVCLCAFHLQESRESLEYVSILHSSRPRNWYEPPKYQCVGTQSPRLLIEQPCVSLICVNCVTGSVWNTVNRVFFRSFSCNLSIKRIILKIWECCLEIQISTSSRNMIMNWDCFVFWSQKFSWWTYPNNASSFLKRL